MVKESNTSIGEKLGSFVNFIKNAKFLVLSIAILVFFGVAVLSGNSKDIALNFYENVTGKRFQTFTPIKDYSSETYLILKDTLSRNTNIGFESAEIAIFEESDISHKYRVKLNEEINFYTIKKQPNGTWHIIDEQ